MSDSSTKLSTLPTALEATSRHPSPVLVCAGILAVFALAVVVPVVAQSYPLARGSLCGSTDTCQQVVDDWNSATRAALVDDDFNTLMGAPPLAAVRWYTTEGTCTGSELCDDQLNSGDDSCSVLDTATSFFCGVTDELSNVLLSHAMGSDQAEYEKLHNFTELLRHPDINGLQCWKYYVRGEGAYDSYEDLCQETDSASDASLRILLAYSIACAKQEVGIWSAGAIDYCTDYLEQGNTIWGNGTSMHGEIKLLSNGQYFLANGFNNQPNSPTATDSFRPDYYELQALMDFARFIGNPAFQDGVRDMLGHYGLSLGDNHIHGGKTGHFDADVTVHTCDQLCSPPYMDNSDTWRAVPALSGLFLVHPDEVPANLRVSIFDHWWSNYSGGHPILYGPTAVKPFEIYSQSSDGGVRQTEASYKTLGMWIPLAAAYDADYTREAIDHLVDDRYNAVEQRFQAAAYYGGYFSQFAQRAIGAATGMIDPDVWRGRIWADGFESGDTSGWTLTVP